MKKQKYTSSRDLLIKQYKESGRIEWLMRGVQETVDRMQNLKRRQYDFEEAISEYLNGGIQCTHCLKKIHSGKCKKSFFQKLSNWVHKITI